MAAYAQKNRGSSVLRRSWLWYGCGNHSLCHVSSIKTVDIPVVELALPILKIVEVATVITFNDWDKHPDPLASPRPS